MSVAQCVPQPASPPPMVIRLERVSKDYPIFPSPFARLKQLIAKGRRKYYETFRALNEVSLSIPAGEVFGLLGENGSGKSTLLQLIAGIITPTSGSVEVRGRIAALLELGAGFNPEFTGRENIFLSASLLGLSRAEIEERFDGIIAFADIGDFIDRPVKTYSSGMFARLAFAVASSVSADILIVDEILAVGDAKFQARCFARLRELRASGTTIFFVSHSAEQIVQHCTRAAVMERGNLVFVGEPAQAVNQYLDRLFGRSRQSAPDGGKTEQQVVAVAPASDAPARFFETAEELYPRNPLYNKYEHRWGDRAAEILDFEVRCLRAAEVISFAEGDRVELLLKIRFNREIARPIYGFTLKTKEGVIVFGSNSELAASASVSSAVSEGEVVLIKFQFGLHVSPGDYFVSVGVASYSSGELIPHDRRYDSMHLAVIGHVDFYGLARLPFEVSRL